MIRVMTATTKGSHDGIHVREYIEGETYDLPEKLALAFDMMGVAEVPASKAPPVELEPVEPEVKSMNAAPSNKAAEKIQEQEEPTDVKVAKKAPKRRR